MLLGPGGQVGEVPEAESWEWLPGAPCGSDCCCEGQPACEFVGLHDSSDIVRSGGVQLLPGFPPKKAIWQVRTMNKVKLR